MFLRESGKGKGRGREESHLDVGDGHLIAPQPRELVQHLARALDLDHAPDGVVRAAHPPLDLEVDLGHEVQLRAPHEALVAELVLHLTEEDATRVHVWLREEAVPGTSATPSFRPWGHDIPRLIISRNRARETHYLSPLVRSFPLPSRLKNATPSIMLAAEFPRNLLRGFSVPSTRTPWSGAM